jgi:hypothetical protein
MKLTEIAEGFLSSKLKEAYKNTESFERPFVQSNPLFNPSSGHDAGSRSTGSTSSATGIPNNMRHRKFFGLSNRPGSIVL